MTDVYKYLYVSLCVGAIKQSISRYMAYVSVRERENAKTRFLIYALCLSAQNKWNTGILTYPIKYCVPHVLLLNVIEPLSVVKNGLLLLMGSFTDKDKSCSATTSINSNHLQVKCFCSSIYSCSFPKALELSRDIWLEAFPKALKLSRDIWLDLHNIKKKTLHICFLYNHAILINSSTILATRKV